MMDDLQNMIAILISYFFILFSNFKFLFLQRGSPQGAGTPPVDTKFWSFDQSLKITDKEMPLTVA